MAKAKKRGQKRKRTPPTPSPMLAAALTPVRERTHVNVEDVTHGKYSEGSIDRT